MLEKGLSFRDSRPLFGKQKVRQLIDELNNYIEHDGSIHHVQFQSALNVLNAYIDRQRAEGHANDPYLIEICEAVDLLQQKCPRRISGGGWIDANRRDIQQRAKGSFPEMNQSRYSVRHFDPDPVPETIIEQAVAWAQKSPSVCNRQSSRVHAVTDKKNIEQVLKIHGGTRGFTEQINVLLIVTGDLRVFLGPTERNQVYTDSGFFMMSLLYGLHYLGVGACPLHWCVSPQQDKAARLIAKIPAEETITALIGVGILPEEFKVAHSQRRKTEDILIWQR